MINRRTLFSLFLPLAASAAWAAGQPGAFSEGSTIGGGGWKFSYTTVAKPALSTGQHIKIQTDATHTDAAGRPTVFHRFFTDPVSRTYFGYDLLVKPLGQSNTAIVKFQPLTLRGDQLPRKYASAEFKAVGLPRFPAQTFKSGETIAVEVLENPVNGQKVVDYIQVMFAPGGESKSGTHETVSVAAAPADFEKAKTIGMASAPIRIELYSDFECPACRAFHETVLPSLIRDYVNTGKAYFVGREFPLPMHPHSREAAYLATAAALVGKYQVVADTLFLNQPAWAASGKVWETIAPVLSPAEQKKVQELAQSPAILAQVQQEADSAVSQRVDRTPTLMLIRGAKRYPFPGPGPENYGLLKSLLEEMLK